MSQAIFSYINLFCFCLISFHFRYGSNFSLQKVRLMTRQFDIFWLKYEEEMFVVKNTV